MTMNENDIIGLLESVINQPLLFALLIIINTFILEDLAITATAIITAQNEISIYIPAMALFTGIVIGDIGLYAIGKYSSRLPFLQRFINHKKMQKARTAIDQNLILTIFTSRFIPGMRLPTYTAVGFFNISFRKFLFAVLVAVGLWSSAVFYLFYTFGDIAEDMLGTFKWYGLGTAVILFMILPRLLKIVSSFLVNKK